MDGWARHRRDRSHRRARTRLRLRLLDAVAVAWIAAWITVAVLVGIDVAHLEQLSYGLGILGGAVTTTGHGLQPLTHLPLVGHDLASVANQLVTTGNRTVSTAHSITGSVRGLSYLLPIVIALVPVVPTLALYVPARMQRRRELHAVRRALRETADHDRLELYLARRAVAVLPFHQLREISSDPWRDLESGSVRSLAEAEMDRLGLDRRALSSEDGTFARPD